MQAIVLSVALFAVTLAGCASDGADDHLVPDQDEEGRYVIEVGPDGRLVYQPAKAQVPVGSTVVFVDAAGGFHNVVSDGDGPLDSGDAQTTPWTYEFTFTEAGTYHYHCDPHRNNGMTGTILVE